MKLSRNDACWCGSGLKYKKCHEMFDEKIEAIRRQRHVVPSHDIIKNKRQIELIKDSAKINIEVLDYVAENIKAGMATEEIDHRVYEKTIAMGGIPAPLKASTSR